MRSHPGHFRHGRRTAALAVAALLVAAPGRAAEPAPSGRHTDPTARAGDALSLAEAIRLTRAGHPALRAAAATADAARARRRVAGRRPDPTLALGVENVGGNLGTDRAETTLLLEHTLERGRDRAARSGLADAEATLAGREHDHLAIALEAETVARFCEAWALQERVRRLADSERLAERAVAAAAERLEAGAAPSFERTRAEGVLALRRIERQRAAVEHETALERLATQWGAESVAFDSLALPDRPPAAVPPLADLLAGLDRHPGLRRAAAERMTHDWRVRAARAARVSDLQVGLGVRHLAGTGGSGGTGLLFGVSMPLRIRGGGAAAVEAARAELAAATERERLAALELRGEVRAAHRRHASALAAWEAIRDRVRPAAEEAATQIAAAYRAGRLGSLEIQESQRSLLEADLLLIDGYAVVWRTRHALERLMRPAPDAPPPGEGR